MSKEWVQALCILYIKVLNSLTWVLCVCVCVWLAVNFWCSTTFFFFLRNVFYVSWPLAASLEQFTWEAAFQAIELSTHLIKHNSTIRSYFSYVHASLSLSDTTVTHILHSLALLARSLKLCSFSETFLFLQYFNFGRYFFSIQVQWSNLILNPLSEFSFQIYFSNLEIHLFYSLFLLYIYAFINVLFKNEREKERVCYVYWNEETQAVCVNIIWSKIIFLWSFTGLHLFIGVL